VATVPLQKVSALVYLLQKLSVLTTESQCPCIITTEGQCPGVIITTESQKAKSSMVATPYESLREFVPCSFVNLI